MIKINDNKWIAIMVSVASVAMFIAIGVGVWADSKAEAAEKESCAKVYTTCEQNKASKCQDVLALCLKPR